MDTSITMSQKLSKKLKALIIEDLEDDAILLVSLLKRAGYNVIFDRVDTLHDLGIALKQEWDIVFSDHSMPTMDGIAALAEVRAHNKNIPFIFVSGTIGEDSAVKAMRMGAQDYIMKGNLKRLIPAVQRELSEAHIREERVRAEKHLRYLTHYDSLTDLPNRFYFLEQVQNNLSRSNNDDCLTAIVYVDLDRFKAVNDSLGYQAGNLLLTAVSERLTKHVNSRGTICRIAADEFAIEIPKCSTRLEAEKWVKSIFECLEHPYEILACSLYFSASIGVALYPDHATSAADLLGKADIAANRAKDEGGRGYRIFESTMAVRLEERLALERNMRVGLKQGEFRVLYQPQVDLKTGCIVGAEALLRWTNSERGPVRPDHFIPLAEETGFIIPLTNWVLTQVCQQIKRWESEALRNISIAVNVSARQFQEDHIPQLLEKYVNEYQINPKLLKVEVTESVIIRNAVRASDIFAEIQSMGVEIALDDFGTGYSSLSYLRTFKANYLKIDQSFIRELVEDESCQAIVKSIIAMSNQLSIKTIAEGVETQSQWKLLTDMGCDYAQGYFFGRAMLASDLQKRFIMKWSEKRA